MISKTILNWNWRYDIQSNSDRLDHCKSMITHTKAIYLTKNYFTQKKLGWQISQVYSMVNNHWNLPVCS